MKCHKPNTDQSCEVFITAVAEESEQYAEYVIPPDPNNPREPRPNLLECFIPVSDGEQLIVNINFSGTVLHGSADVLADGAFVFDKRIEGDSKKGKVRFQKRQWTVGEVYDVPGSTDVESMHSGTAIVAGGLWVKALDEGDVPVYIKNGGKLGLGTLAVIVSVNQETEDMYDHKYQHQTIGNWRTLPANHADGGIIPQHELEFRLEDDEVHFNRQQRHKRHMEQTRFGMKPWAIFVFYYRSQAAIQSAQCIARVQREQMLEPHFGPFRFADPEATKKKRLATRARNERQKALEAERSFSMDGSSDGTSTEGYERRERRERHGDGGLFVSRSPSQHSDLETQVPKKKLMGNRLGLQSATSYAQRKDSRVSEDDLATAAEQGQMEQEVDWDRLLSDAAAEKTIAAAQPQPTTFEGAGPQDIISDVNQGEQFDFNLFDNFYVNDVVDEINQALQNGDFGYSQGPAGAPIAKMVATSPSQHSSLALPAHSAAGDAVQSVEYVNQHQNQPPEQHPHHSSSDIDDEEQAEPSSLAQMITNTVQHRAAETNAAKAARIEARAAMKKPRTPPAPKGKPVFDPTAKTGYGYGNPKMAPKQSLTSPTQQAMQQLDTQDTQAQEMLQSYFQSQDQAEGRQNAAPRQKAATLHRPWETDTQPPTSTRALYPMSPPNRPAHPSIGALAESTGAPQARATSPYTPSDKAAIAASKKRASSITSHNSSSSKKARAAEMSARKATILAQLEQRKKAKEAEQAKLEEERRAREELERRREEEERLVKEQEEAAEAELAALEAELASADAEVEAIREQGRKESEEARMRDLEREREID